MGSDSVRPFIDHSPLEKGVYVLNRTSNPGGKDLQNLTVHSGEATSTLYQEVAAQIISYNNDRGCVGAVVGATNMEELKDIASLYAKHAVPLLIPGVGSQGGSAPSVMAALREVGYPVKLARINSSSALTHPWKKGEAPEDWLEMCESSLRKLLRETKV
jgi:orotidine-5'-phosphate decarboxylase